MLYLNPHIPISIRKLFSDKRDIGALTNRSATEQPMDGHISALRHWRKLRGVLLIDTAKALNVNEDWYRSVENGTGELATEEIYKFCSLMDIIPLDLYNIGQSPQPRALIEILAHSYSSPSELEKLTPNFQEDIMDAFYNEISTEESYNSLHGAMMYYYKAGGQINYEIAKFIQGLLVNDGNPEFEKLGAVHCIMDKQDELKSIASREQCEHDLLQSQKKKTIDEQAIDYFGKLWVSYKRLLDDLQAEGWSQAEIKDFAINDLPIEGERNLKQANAIWHAYVSLTETDDDLNKAQKKYEKANRRLKEFNMFFKTYAHSLASFDNRQIIITHIPELKLKSQGNANHKLYISPPSMVGNIIPNNTMKNMPL